MIDICGRVDIAVSEWERGDLSDSQSLFFIINHARACARCERTYGALIPLIRRDTGQSSGLAAAIGQESPAFAESVMRKVTRVTVGRFSASAARTARWVLPIAGCIALLLGVGSFVLQSRLASQSSEVMVHFTLEAPSASHVSLAGDFNGWRPGELKLKTGPNGVWEITVALRRGAIYTYDFLIDGERWVPDPHSESRVDDGFGGVSSVLKL
jgi:Carbohydrate-binding module 48 (Isoamylase N-terminal domain)